VARASLVGLVAGIGFSASVACGKFLASEEPEATGNDAAADGILLDGVVVDGLAPGADGSADGSADAAADAGPPRSKCVVGSAFPAAVAAAPKVSVDVRSVRLRANTLFFAHVPGGVGIDLGAAPLLPDGGPDTPKSWFDQVNDTEGQTIPAPSADGLTILFQNGPTSDLRFLKRNSLTTAFLAPQTVALTGAAVMGILREPYLTSSNELYFSTSEDRLYFAKTSGNTIDVQRELTELGPGQFPVASDDGLEIFFVREENDTQKIFRAKRDPGEAIFGLPAKDIPLSNDSFHTRVSWISPDACRLFLIRATTSGDNGPFILQVATRN
jgi:hypothetical protein